jgi:hypothetical protein
MARRQSVPSPMNSPQASQRPSTSWKRCCFVASENDRARGKRLVILLGQKKAVAIAVKNVSGRRRWSKLREWLNPAGVSIPRSIGA